VNRTRLVLLLATMLFAHSAATAAGPKVFRCGPDGRIYSQTPCKDGYEVNADDKRSAEQRKAAEETVRRDEKLNQTMARERHATEVAAAKVGPAKIGNASAAKPPASAASGAAAKKKRAAKNPVQT
jgi:hypothetical protein